MFKLSYLLYKLSALCGDLYELILKKKITKFFL